MHVGWISGNLVERQGAVRMLYYFHHEQHNHIKWCHNIKYSLMHNWKSLMLLHFLNQVQQGWWHLVWVGSDLARDRSPNVSRVCWEPLLKMFRVTKKKLNRCLIKVSLRYHHWRFSEVLAEGAGSVVCNCLSRFRVRQNLQCSSLVSLHLSFSMVRTLFCVKEELKVTNQAGFILF